MSSAATPPLVIWTLMAQRRLRQALARAVCRDPNALDTQMTELAGRLQLLFPWPDVRAVVVQDQFVGYRRRDDEFIFLVEVDGSCRNGRHVVKLAPPDRLRRELDGWDRCRPHGLHHDLVFMTLEERRGEDGKLAGLVYGDAQQFLGVPQTLSLESAFLGAVCYGAPSVASVALALGQLYERIGHLLYPQSFVEDPAAPGFALRLPTVRSTLAEWEQTGAEAARIRQSVNTWAASGRDDFRDPVDFLRFLEGFVRWEEPSDSGPIAPRLAGDSRSESPTMPEPDPTAPLAHHWVPRMLRGCAHGDLHGRNVLVGVVRNRALWPAVFDYGNMGPCNLLGWDFVKMETELKMRAYPELYVGGGDADFVRAVQTFEIDLAERTEECHRRSHWPEAPAGDEREARLRSLLMVLRQQAALHLGADRSRPREWLDEFYFLLACYGVSIVRFPNVLPRERMGAYVSAGVAAARFVHNRESRGAGGSPA